MNGVNQADDIAQQIAALHAVGQPLKHGSDHVAPLSTGSIAPQIAQIGEQAGTLRAGGQRGLLVSQKRQQVRPGQAVGRSGPVAPAVGRGNRAAIRPPGQFGALFLNTLQVVQELEKHDPGQHGQAVQVAVQALVLAHDLARRLDDAVEALGRGEWFGCGFLADGFGHDALFLSGSLSPGGRGLG